MMSAYYMETFSELTVAWQAVIAFGFLADAQKNHVCPYGILKAAANEIYSSGINQKPCN